MKEEIKFKYPYELKIVDGNDKFNLPVRFIFIFNFKNGYGASVITNGYNQEKGLLELAVTKNNKLYYNTKITNDVIPCLTVKDVNKLLDRIKKLKSSETK